MEHDFIIPKKQDKALGDVKIYNNTTRLMAVKVRIGGKGEIEVYIYELEHDEY